jgi:hypothetical protein
MLAPVSVATGVARSRQCRERAAAVARPLLLRELSRGLRSLRAVLETPYGRQELCR